MIIVKSIETPERKVWIEQHNDYFLLKSQESNIATGLWSDVAALKAIQNLTLVLDMFETLVGRKILSN